MVTPGTFDAADPGTSAEVWDASGYRQAATALDIGAVRRLVVLAAHPDDETLMAGGLIAAVAARGVPVQVVIATAGDASHPHSPTWTPEALAEERGREVRAAVSRLAPAASVTLLGLPDGRLADSATALREALTPLIEAGDTVVATWRSDRHGDHEALGGVAAGLVEASGATLLEAPIWAWHWGDPAESAHWPGAVRFDLDPNVAAAKRAALAEHVTQIAPLSDAPGDERVLSARMLAHFARDDEIFFPTASRAAVDFDAMYEASDDPWGFEDRWYERRKRAITVASLPAEHYGRALEIGCSNGLLAEQLAMRSDELIATDVAPRAVELASARLARFPHARVRLARLPEAWPEGTFDLIVLSETGFYLAGDRLRLLAGRCRDALTPGGVLLLCHWRPLVVGLDRDGDAVHEIMRTIVGGERLVRHDEDDFLLEVVQTPPAASVARATGLR